MATEWLDFGADVGRDYFVTQVIYAFFFMKLLIVFGRVVDQALDHF